jgi:hypothetical protein
VKENALTTDVANRPHASSGVGELEGAHIGPDAGTNPAFDFDVSQRNFAGSCLLFRNRDGDDLLANRLDQTAGGLFVKLPVCD